PRRHPAGADRKRLEVPPACAGGVERMALDENALHDVAPLASSSLSGSQRRATDPRAGGEGDPSGIRDSLSPHEFRLMKPHPLGFSCYRAHVYVIERHLLPGAPIPGSFFSTDWQIASASDAEAHAAAGDPPGCKTIIAWGEFWKNGPG